MNKRLKALETETAKATLAELRKRRGTLTWVILATDATPDGRGGYQSATLELLASLPSELYLLGIEALDRTSDIEVRPHERHD